MERGTFRQEGTVDWRRLPVGLMLQLGPMLLVGALLAALQSAGYYILILVPIFVAIIPAMFSAWIANWMKWREPRAAGTVGFVLGVLAYFAQFYVAMVYFNPAAVWRLDWVPLVVIEFTNNVRIGDEIDPVKAWGFLFVETVILGVAFSIAHVQVSQNLYCPLCSAPLKKKSSILPPDFAAALAEGIASGNMDDLPRDESGGEIEGDAWSAVEVLYCFHGGQKIEPLFYLTLRETRFTDGVGANFLMFEKVLLSAEEMIAIGEKCPGLLITPGSPATVTATESTSDDSAA